MGAEAGKSEVQDHPEYIVSSRSVLATYDLFSQRKMKGMDRKGKLGEGRGSKKREKGKIGGEVHNNKLTSMWHIFQGGRKE